MGVSPVGILWYNRGVKRRRIIVLVCACVVVGVAFVVWPRERQPEYQGKKLSEWLLECSAPSPSTRVEARKAVKEIGTNAVPWLLEWLRYEEPAWKGKVYSWAYKVKWINWGQWLNRRFSPWRAGGPNRLASVGFAQLGEQAASARPELKRLMHYGKTVETRVIAECCLRFTAEQLNSEMKKDHPWARGYVLNGIVLDSGTNRSDGTNN
jgi:hypothetical protein